MLGGRGKDGIHGKEIVLSIVNLVLSKVFREVISVVFYRLSMIVITCGLTVHTAPVQMKFFFALFVMELFASLNLKSFLPLITSSKTKYHPC